MRQPWAVAGNSTASANLTRLPYLSLSRMARAFAGNPTPNSQVRAMGALERRRAAPVVLENSTRAIPLR